MYKGKNRSAPRADAVFIGWLTTPWGEASALYNIIASGHPRYGSTVTCESLRRLRLKVPRTPRAKERLKRSYS